MGADKQLLDKIDALAEDLRKSEHIARMSRQDVTIALPYKEYEMYKKMFGKEDDNGS